MGVVSRDSGYAALVKRAIGLKPVTIATGVLAKDGGAAKRGAEGGELLTLIGVAVFNEFGTSTIPERSFIRAWFDEAEPELRGKLTVLMREVVAGRRTRAQVLELMGQYCVGQIQARIADGISPENAPATVARKGSSTPLIASGQLRSAISYEVREGT